MLRVGPPPFQNCKRFDQVRGMIKAGTYTGDGAGQRDIDIGIDLAAKSNVFVELYISDETQQMEGMRRIEFGQGGCSIGYNNTRFNNAILSFTSTGFRVGTHPECVNSNGKNYCYIAFWEEP